jgi:putative transposase
MKLKGWTLPKRRTGRRPRAEASRSVAASPNERWATDLALVHCGRDGWCVFVPVIDCCTREILGHALERTGRAKAAERALEEALLHRFGTLRNAPAGMVLRHDNGLVFGSRQYRAVVKDYGLTQEYITPYTPKQNGLCERFIKTFKEELCWTRRFQSIEHARLAVRAWIDHYNNRRPHQSLKYLSPTQYHQRRCKRALSVRIRFGCPRSAKSRSRPRQTRCPLRERCPTRWREIQRRSLFPRNYATPPGRCFPLILMPPL